MRGRRIIRSMLGIGALCALANDHQPATAFCTLQTKWSTGQARMAHNFPATSLLLNGTTAWQANTRSAMDEWSAVTGDFEFINAGEVNAGQNNRDNINNMVFANDAAGDAFADDVLAITLTRSDASGNSIESDIVFNADVQWNAYDGPIRVDGSGRAVFDFRRVALHELGHVLGLDHPDTSCGESVESIMNSLTTDIDRLTEDDRNAVSFLYSDGNQPPIADAGHDQFGDGTQEFLLNGGESTDPDGFIVLYEWYIDGELVARGRAATIPLRRGMYTVELRVTDDHGAASSDITIIRVGSEFAPPPSDNQSPVADAGEDQDVESGETVVLDGSESYDPDGSIVRYVWSLSSSILGRDPSIVVSLPNGTYFISLTVFDSQGGAGSDRIIVIVGGDGAMPATIDPPPPPDDSPQTSPPPPAGPSSQTSSPCGAIGFIPLAGMFLAFVTLRAKMIP